MRDGKAVERIEGVVLVLRNFLSDWYLFIVGVGPNRNTSARIPHGRKKNTIIYTITVT